MSDLPSTHVDADAWVAAAADDSGEHVVRRVMRVILLAVARSPRLNGIMAVKGGVLLALGYGTDRHTKDVDFSTIRTVQEEDVEGILTELSRALESACGDADDELLCRVQKREMKPPAADASFPTLRIRVGYAIKGEKEFRRMVQGRPSAKVVLIDLSFNEQTCYATSITIDGHELAAYSLFDQAAEKYRAMIQQTSARRGRIRRQDVYDLYRLISMGYLATADDRAYLLAAMRQKFTARDLPCERGLIEDPEIAERSRSNYHRLQDEIDGGLPDFDLAFGVVKEFYLSLPWDRAGRLVGA